MISTIALCAANTSARTDGNPGLPSKSVEVRFTQVAPRIDGVIEEVWQNADSACDFIQFQPYENQQASEKTVVYVLQDRENLYVAFRCSAQKHKPTACLTADEDFVSLALDPFGSKTTAYYFTVFASGIYVDGWILDDGRNEDDSWDGVWFRGVGVHEDRLDVEMKIPSNQCGTGKIWRNGAWPSAAT